MKPGLITVFLSLVFLSSPAFAGLSGDIQGDGVLNVSDVQCLVLVALNLTPEDPVTVPTCLDPEASADLNCDAETNVVDIQLEVGMVLGALVGQSGIPQAKDSDQDSIHNDCDNCPETSNTDQSDTNENGLGDACDISSPCDAEPCGPNGLCYWEEESEESEDYQCFCNPGWTGPSCEDCHFNLCSEGAPYFGDYFEFCLQNNNYSACVNLVGCNGDFEYEGESYCGDSTQILPPQCAIDALTSFEHCQSYENPVDLTGYSVELYQNGESESDLKFSHTFSGLFEMGSYIVVVRKATNLVTWNLMFDPQLLPAETSDISLFLNSATQIEWAVNGDDDPVMIRDPSGALVDLGYAEKNLHNRRNSDGSWSSDTTSSIAQNAPESIEGLEAPIYIYEIGERGSCRLSDYFGNYVLLYVSGPE